MVDVYCKWHFNPQQDDTFRCRIRHVHDIVCQRHYYGCWTAEKRIETEEEEKNKRENRIIFGAKCTSKTDIMCVQPKKWNMDISCERGIKEKRKEHRNSDVFIVAHYMRLHVVAYTDTHHTSPYVRRSLQTLLHTLYKRTQSAVEIGVHFLKKKKVPSQIGSHTYRHTWNIEKCRFVVFFSLCL